VVDRNGEGEVAWRVQFPVFCDVLTIGPPQPTAIARLIQCGLDGKMPC